MAKGLYNNKMPDSGEREYGDVTDRDDVNRALLTRSDRLQVDARSQPNSVNYCCTTPNRLLGVDFGYARIGLSVSDPLQIIASPLPSVHGSKNPSMAAKTVSDEIKRRELNIGLIVVGLPIHLNGSESERSAEVRVFADKLKELSSIDVQLFDERLTTVQAERLLKEASMRRKQRVPVIDGVTSTLLLQSFLDRQGRTLS